MTLPVSPWQAVAGKWLAGLAFIAVALAATFPLWITVNYLGNPDNGVIALGYLGALGFAGVLLAIGVCISALTKNQVIAFVVAVAVCFGVVTAGTPIVLDTVRAFLPQAMVDLVAAMSALTHYSRITQGVLPLASVVYIISMIVFWLFANTAVLSLKKAG